METYGEIQGPEQNVTSIDSVPMGANMPSREGTIRSWAPGSQTYRLRPYQSECLEAIKVELQKSTNNRLLIALPTASGKTVIFSQLPSLLNWLPGRRWLVLAHREELLNQAAEKISAANPALRVAIEQADRRAGDADVVVASVPSLQRKRLEDLDPSEFCGIITDECHHATANTYQAIFEHFGIMAPGCTRPLIGFTATPKRGDDVGLGAVFQKIVYEARLPDMIEAGWLCQLTGRRVATGTSLEGVQVRAGDFVAGQLADAVDTDARNGIIGRAYQEHASGRRALAFCVGVEHAKRVAETFKALGVPAGCVVGETPKDERADILRRFAAGELRVVSNCGCLTEGFDDPGVSCILMARPTKSSLLYTQIVGRGTRLAPGKSDCLVLDFVDASARHVLGGVATLVGLPAGIDLEGKPAMAIKKQLDLITEKYPWIDVEQVRRARDLELVTSDINFFQSKAPPEIERFTHMAWMRTPDGGYRLSLPSRDRRNEKLEVSPSGLDTWRLFLVRDGRKEQLREEPKLADALAHGDLYVRTNDTEATKVLDLRCGWRNNPASDKQLALLCKLHIQHPAWITKGMAAQMITMKLDRRR
jgi:ATP-dependent helicase IRC3